MNRSNKSLSKHSMDGLYQDIVEIPSDEVWETRTSPTFFTVKNHSELALMGFWRGTGSERTQIDAALIGLGTGANRIARRLSFSTELFAQGKSITGLFARTL